MKQKYGLCDGGSWETAGLPYPRMVIMALYHLIVQSSIEWISRDTQKLARLVASSNDYWSQNSPWVPNADGRLRQVDIARMGQDSLRYSTVSSHLIDEGDPDRSVPAYPLSFEQSKRRCAKSNRRELEHSFELVVRHKRYLVSTLSTISQRSVAKFLNYPKTFSYRSHKVKRV